MAENQKKNIIRKPLIFMHRGCEKWPNNRLAPEALKENGVDYIELDVRKTADNILVVSHYRSLKNTVRRVLVDKNTYKQLYKKTGRKLPKLNEVVGSLNGQVKFNFDLKQEGMLSEIVELIKRHGLEKKTIVDSWFSNDLKKLAQIFPGVLLAYSYNYRDKKGLESIKFFKMAAYLSYFLFYPFWPRVVKYITKKTTFVPGASIYYRLVNKGIVKYFRDRKIPVYVWPVNSERAMRRMVELGVDGIKTSKPELLKKILKSDL